MSLEQTADGRETINARNQRLLELGPRPPFPIILKTLVGSTVYGINVDDGVEDTDEMGVCIEPIENVLSVGHTQHFEQYIWRSAALREGRTDAKSRAGDLDLVVYSLRKYVKLALSGNPTVLVPLFAPVKPIDYDSRGAQLRELSQHIVSRRAGHAFLGYLTQQLERLTGVRGQKNVNRPELVARYGFDTKYAVHALRLGFQGVELLTTGRLSLPLEPMTRGYLLEVRTGQVPLEEVLGQASRLKQTLVKLLDSSTLPPNPSVKVVEEWMVDVYYRAWHNTRLHADEAKRLGKLGLR